MLGTVFGASGIVRALATGVLLAVTACGPTGARRGGAQARGGADAGTSAATPALDPPLASTAGPESGAGGSGGATGSGGGGASAGGNSGGAPAGGTGGGGTAGGPGSAPDAARPDAPAPTDGPGRVDTATARPDAAAPDAAPPADGPAANVIDDLDDCDNHIAAVDGRTGFWFGYVDKAGSMGVPDPTMTFKPSAGGRTTTSRCYAHLTGTTVSGGYVGWGVFFMQDTAAVDLSRFTGIELWARGTGNFAVSLGDGTSRYGTAMVPVSNADWQRVTLKWSDFSKAGAGPPLTTMKNLQLDVWGNQTFDLSIDDLSFTR